ncbi:hypothetical protein [Devosia psychrophila]|uniref:ATPase, P-type (Transporting), HAD superfamily, subfamily IC n=1 Tax=Devosia psychrophila TaxID=728005 RepID=A0A0F5PUR0_9HYPH|nr:hypothetical protein [Devosia psychrophila]KKC32373.1 hypothetical protein WH91_13770 [Devosia psychrophila]SFC15682.1 ATPase, P-type (transporting), HAD superfamily, subfamily IC [Devosia psychrophila]
MTQLLVIVTEVFAANVFLGRPLIDSLLFGAALAVGLFPQLLAVVTVTLALAAGKLAEAGVLVKRSVAIENLGAMEVLCTHKTGTLTDGKAHLDRALDFSGNSLEATIMWAVLNAKLQTGLYGAPSGLLESRLGELQSLLSRRNARAV